MILSGTFTPSRAILRRVYSGLCTGIIGVCLILITLGLSGCNRIEEEGETGQVIIGLTDTEGDFIRYKVDVVSLTLTKANDAVVETIPLSTEVDFAQYTEMTEFLTAATIPSGFYTKATLRLDYQDADIWYSDPNGDAVQIHSILDEDGNAVSTVEMPVHLESVNTLLILPGIPAHLTLDFNLLASNRVDDMDPNTLILQPFLMAEVNTQSSKIHRVRGPLKAVDPDGDSLVIIIRPFFHAISGGDEHFGTLSVTTTTDTIYLINGTFSYGYPGLEALAYMPEFTATVVIGDLKFNPQRFEAREVRAGSSVAGGTLDVVTGNVTSRDPNTLTVRGATLIRADSSNLFNDSVTVLLDANTLVGRQFSQSPYDANDISVGQLVTIFGTLDPNAPDPQMDADLVILLLTTLRGTVVNKGTGEMDIKLQSINGRRVGIFDFDGTGIDDPNDADPNNYRITTGALNTSSLDTGSPVKVLGFVRRFGQAPADFVAYTIVDVAQIPALMAVGWLPADPNAFETLSSTGLTLDLHGVGLFHHLNRAGVVIDLKELAKSPSIKPLESGTGLYSIAEGVTRQLHTSFGNFAADLEDRLVANGSVRNLVAIGTFDDANAILTAGAISVRME